MRLFTEIFFLFVRGGEALSLVATRETMSKLRAQPTIEKLWHQGAKLKGGFSRLAADTGIAGNTRCIGLAPHSAITYADHTGPLSLAMRTLLFQQQVAKLGILFLVGFNLSCSHSDEKVPWTLATCREALAILADALAGDDVERRLEGPIVQPVFRRA